MFSNPINYNYNYAETQAECSSLLDLLPSSPLRLPSTVRSLTQPSLEYMGVCDPYPNALVCPHKGTEIPEFRWELIGGKYFENKFPVRAEYDLFPHPRRQHIQTPKSTQDRSHPIQT